MQIEPGINLRVTHRRTNETGASGLVIGSDQTGTDQLINNTEGVEATVEQ